MHKDLWREKNYYQENHIFFIPIKYQYGNMYVYPEKSTVVI